MKKIISYFLFLNFLIGLGLLGWRGEARADSDLDLKEGYESFLKRDYPRALATLQHVNLSKGNLLRDYWLYALGRSQLETGDAASALKNLTLLIDEEPDSLWRNAAQVQRALAWVATGQFQKAKDAIAAKLDTFSGELKGDALYALGLAEIGLGEKPGGIDHLKQSYYRFPNPNLDPQLLAKLKELGFSPSSSPQDSLDRVYRMLEAKSYSRALEASESLMQAEGSIGSQARVLHGEALYNLKRYGDAALYLQGEGVPLEWRRQALLHLGMSQFHNNEEAQAKLTLAKVQELFPGTPEGEEALYRIGMIDHQAQRFSEARAEFETLATAYPHGNFRDKALWAGAWAAYRSSDWNGSMAMLKLLEQGAADPPTLGKALYWKGRVFEKQGDSTHSQESWQQTVAASPYSYYGAMALKKMKGSTDLAETPALPAEWKSSAPALKAAEGKSSAKKDAKKAAPVQNSWDLHFKKAVALSQAGLGKVSSNELDFALTQCASDPQALFSLLEAGKRSTAYFIPVLFGQKYWDKFKGLFADSRAAEDYRAQMMYPFAYRSEVEKAGQETGLSPHFIVALMRQESGFMPWVISSANAQGLMQLLPATATNRARSAGIAGYDLLNPADNIRLGAAELAAMVAKFSNNWILAIAAYNAGPGRSNQWSGEFGTLPPDEFVEEIPFAETNLYVKLVLRNYWAYKMLHP